MQDPESISEIPETSETRMTSIMTASAEAEAKPEAQINNWLPITASRKAKWWYSAFHNVTAMVGAGVLGLPFAMSQLGWYFCNFLKLIQL